MRYLITSLLFLLASTAWAELPQPAPVPPRVTVNSAAPQKELFDKLTTQQQKFAYHMILAANAGKTILFYQNHRHALYIKHFLDKTLRQKHVQETQRILGSAEAFQEWLRYTALFNEKGGPYNGSNRKYLMKIITAGQVKELLRKFDPQLRKNYRGEIIQLLTDPTYEVIQKAEDPHGSDHHLTGGNIYEKGITGEEIQAAVAAGFKTQLNCRVIKTDDHLRCQILALDYASELEAPVVSALQTIVVELEKAKKYAQTENQKAQLDCLIRYFQTGNIEDFRQFNIEWVKDRDNSVVDFMMGFVETYDDHLNQVGSWESYVQIVDPEVTRMSKALAGHAQHFEDQMPYGTFKKVFPRDYSPPALMVKILQEISSIKIAGYNLPNFDDIRRDVGAKNIIRLSLPGESAAKAEMRREVYRTFLTDDKIETALSKEEKSWQTLVLLHEIIGHGSGTYDESKYPGQDPTSVLGSLGAALEEERADLTALVFVNDPALVEVGIYSSQEEANAMRDIMYDIYAVDFFSRLIRWRSLSEAHMRGHWLFINKALESGAIVQEEKAGLRTYKVANYDKFQETAKTLLGLLQDIKANRKEAEMHELFSRYAPIEELHAPWMQDILRHGETMKIAMGSVAQPWKVSKQGRAIDFQVLGEATLEGIAPYFSTKTVVHHPHTSPLIPGGSESSSQ